MRTLSELMTCLDANTVSLGRVLMRTLCELRTCLDATIVPV